MLSPGAGSDGSGTTASSAEVSSAEVSSAEDSSAMGSVTARLRSYRFRRRPAADPRRRSHPPSITHSARRARFPRPALWSGQRTISLESAPLPPSSSHHLKNDTFAQTDSARRPPELPDTFLITAVTLGELALRGHRVLVRTETWVGSRAFCTTLARSSRTEFRSTASFKPEANAASRIVNRYLAQNKVTVHDGQGPVSGAGLWHDRGRWPTVHFPKPSRSALRGSCHTGPAGGERFLSALVGSS